MRFDRPPLPFVGNKMRWWRQLEPMIKLLPQHAVVFDAFGGSFCISRMIKHFRPDCVVICNDAEMYYRKRLNAVKDTNRVLHEMRAAGGYRDDQHYRKYDPDTEKTLAAIVDTGADRYTCERALYQGARNTPRAKVPHSDYDDAACEHWTDGLVMVDEVLCADKARYYAQSCDLVVLDPPYLTTVKSWGAGDYIDATDDARTFCRAVLDDRRCAIWLFDTPGSDLISHAASLGARVIEYEGRSNRQRAAEQLAVVDSIETGRPVQLRHFS